MIGAILAEAWRAMGANKLRTFLTMLGMIIGVGAVVIMLAIGEGAQMIMRQTIATMGSNLFVVLSSFTMTSGVRSGTGSTPTLTLNDANSLRELATVANVAPVQPGSAQVVYGSVNWNSQVYGVTPAYMDVRGWDLQSGDPITDVVCVSAPLPPTSIRDMDTAGACATSAQKSREPGRLASCSASKRVATLVACRSTTGDAPLTVTVSCTVDGVSSVLTVAVNPTLTRMPSRFTVVNPASSNVAT